MSQLRIYNGAITLIVTLLDFHYFHNFSGVFGFSFVIINSCKRNNSWKDVTNPSLQRTFQNRGLTNLIRMTSESDDEIDIQSDFRFQEFAAKISEMGGDPSFLTFDDLSEDDKEEDDSTMTASFTPSLSFMSQLESAPNTLELIGNDKSKNTNPYGKKDLSSGGAMHFMSDDENGVTDFDLEEIGGDPSFLGMDDEEKNHGDDWGGWDGTVDEDAHLDFD